jgi:hypothetical protein
MTRYPMDGLGEGLTKPPENGPKGVHIRLPRGARVVWRTTSAAGVTFTRSHLTPPFTGRVPDRLFSRPAYSPQTDVRMPSKGVRRRS